MPSNWHNHFVFGIFLLLSPRHCPIYQYPPAESVPSKKLIPAHYRSLEVLKRTCCSPPTTLQVATRISHWELQRSPTTQPTTGSQLTNALCRLSKSLPLPQRHPFPKILHLFKISKKVKVNLCLASGAAEHFKAARTPVGFLLLSLLERLDLGDPLSPMAICFFPKFLN